MKHISLLNNSSAALRTTPGGERASASGEGFEAACRPQGLSNGHIRPRRSPIYNKNNDRYDATIEYYPEAQLIRVKTPWMYKSLINKKRRKRGKITYFSRRSRNRLKIKLAKLKKIKKPIFVTLTYPLEYPSMMDSKKDLKNFIKRLKRFYNYRNVGYVWRIELQKRGAPHFHLFIWGMSRSELLYSVPKLWYEVVGSEDIKHLAAGTKVEKIRSGNGITSYVSKYLSKIDNENIQENEESIGRLWGYGGYIPFDDAIERKITRRMAFTILRYLRRRIEFNNEATRHFIVTYPEFWLENHERITGDIVNF